jgi:hypothetical protein
MTDAALLLAAVTVTLWPEGATRQVALSGAHGTNVRRVT